MKVKLLTDGGYKYILEKQGDICEAIYTDSLYRVNVHQYNGDPTCLCFFKNEVQEIYTCRRYKYKKKK